MATFKVDRKALDKVVEKAASVAVKSATKDMQKALDRFRRQYSGQPVEVVKPKLAAMWKRASGSNLDRSRLNQWAKLISQGTRIQLKPGRVV